MEFRQHEEIQIVYQEVRKSLSNAQFDAFGQSTPRIKRKLSINQEYQRCHKRPKQLRI